jgi:zinc-ribbon domain
LIDVVPILAIVFGSFIGIIVVTLVYAAYTEKKEKQYQLALAQLKSQASEKGTVEKEVIKEIVMIPCQYCGSLIPQTALFCSNCGAGRKS